MPACRDITYVLDKLSWMRAERIWPNGRRYTWTDAFGGYSRLRALDNEDYVRAAR